jgi:ribose transport system substrate-binding protein
MLATYGDELIGLFAVNNHTGIGTAKAIKKQGLQDKIMVVAFDADKAMVRSSAFRR